VIGVAERQVRRLLRKLRRKGDRAVIDELRGRPSNRRLPEELRQRVIVILCDPVYRDSDQHWRRTIWRRNTRLS
jgi:hypothetical protein